MIKTVTRSDFKNAFKILRPDNFSCEALDELYDYFEALSEEIEEFIELDVIAICCDFTEESVYDTLESYNLESIEELENKTIVVSHNQLEATVVYKNF
jgi:hypothetical protein